MAASSKMVPKGPSTISTSDSESDFDRDALLAKLFALPLPPAIGWHRHHPTHTPLGRIMRLRGETAHSVSRGEGCPHVRTMTDYLAGRKPILSHHRVAMARHLKVDGRIF